MESNALKRSTTGSTRYQRVADGTHCKPPTDVKHIPGLATNVLLHAAFLIIPMVLLCGVLLGLVFTYRVQPNLPVEESLTTGTDHTDPSFYYVRYSATFLTSVASWSSSLASMLSFSIIALWSYHVAIQWLRDTRLNKSQRLPTPYQLSLVLGILSGGGFGSLWTWTQYLTTWKSRRASQGRSLLSLGLMLLLATSLWLLVFLADTWLHIATRAVPFTHFVDLAYPSPLSFGLLDRCLSGNNSYSYQRDARPADTCSIVFAASSTTMRNNSRVFETLNNFFDFGTLSIHTSTSTIAYLAIPGQANLNETDFTVTTFGAHTTCKAMTRQCHLDNYLGDARPECRVGNTENPALKWQLAYFQDDAMTDLNTSKGVQNPFHFRWFASVNTGNVKKIENPEVESTAAGSGHGMTFLLFCHVDVYDITYDFVNGSVTRFDTKRSNESVTNIMQATMSTVQDPLKPYLQQAASYAATTYTVNELESFLSLSYSKAAMSAFSQVLQRQPTIHAHIRRSFIVARIPKSALWCLIVANLLFAATGAVLAIIVLATPNQETRDAQARLSVAGIIADQFEQTFTTEPVEKIEQLFREYHGLDSIRIGLRETSQGMTLTKA